MHVCSRYCAAMLRCAVLRCVALRKRPMIVVVLDGPGGCAPTAEHVYPKIVFLELAKDPGIDLVCGHGVPAARI